MNLYCIKDEGKYNPSRGDVFCFKSFADRTHAGDRIPKVTL